MPPFIIGSTSVKYSSLPDSMERRHHILYCPNHRIKSGARMCGERTHNLHTYTWPVKSRFLLSSRLNVATTKAPNLPDFQEAFTINDFVSVADRRLLGLRIRNLMLLHPYC
jgi:hypothetical protein